MTTLVTGAGLIGTSFARHAIARGEKVVFVDPEPRADFLKFKLGDSGYSYLRADVRDLPALVAAAQEHDVSTIVHTAGLIGGRVDQSLSAAFDINLGGTRNVAEAARLTGVKRLVHISTFGVYDARRKANGPIAEDFPRGAGRGYGNFKGAKELILEAYAVRYELEVIMLRPANVFGFGHFWSGSSGGMKMQALIEAGIDGKPVRLAATDAITNEYVYARDVGRAVDRAATIPMPRESMFNIGSGRATPFSDVISAVKSIFPALQVEIAPGDSGAGKNVGLDLSRARDLLGWTPEYSLEAALKDYADELRAARKVLR
jgi:nucleoside-diphosphate-sugar epimerase